MSGGRRIAAIAIPIVLVVGTLIALGSSDDDAPAQYTIAGDRLCLTAQREVAQAERRYRHGPDRGDVQALAKSLVAVVATLRAELGELDVPTERIEQLVALEESLLRAEDQLLHLVQDINPNDEERILASAKFTRAHSSKVENDASSLGLTRCSHLAIGVSPSSR